MAKKALSDHLAMDEPMLAQRIELGDQLDVPREVEHFAYFSRQKRADDVAALLRERGYTTETVRAGLRTALVARIAADVQPATTASIMTEVFELVEQGGGEYDGWGGPISPADPA
jgi:hypothetical protein